MNKWLSSTVHAYIDNFGATDVPAVVEVGSRDGHDAVELGRRISRGVTDESLWGVLCLEPNPAQAQVIKENYPFVHVMEVAASDVNGDADFIVYKGDEGDVGSSSLDLNWKAGALEGDVIKVKTIRLDSIITYEDVDIMKIDTEGYSLQVLHGLGDKIRNTKVYHIETETWTGSTQKVKDLMADNGFKLYDEHEQYGNMPDLVFVRV